MKQQFGCCVRKSPHSTHRKEQDGKERQCSETVASCWDATEHATWSVGALASNPCGPTRGKRIENTAMVCTVCRDVRRFLC